MRWSWRFFGAPRFFEAVQDVLFEFSSNFDLMVVSILFSFFQSLPLCCNCEVGKEGLEPSRRRPHMILSHPVCHSALPLKGNDLFYLLRRVKYFAFSFRTQNEEDRHQVTRIKTCFKIDSRIVFKRISSSDEYDMCRTCEQRLSTQLSNSILVRLPTGALFDVEQRGVILIHALKYFIKRLFRGPFG